MKKLTFKRPSKKAIILMSVGLVVLLIVGYVAASLLGWHRHQQTVARQASEWQQQVDAIIALDTASREETAQKISEYQQRVESVTCEPSVLIAWQQHLVSSWESSVADCQTDMLHYANLSNALDQIARYLEGQDELATLLKSAGELPETQGVDDWRASHDAWQELVDKLDAVDATDELEPLVSAAKTAASGIVDAWEQLLEAHEGEAADAFRQGREDLNAAYEELAGLDAVNKRQMEQLLSGFEAAYERVAAEKV